jgi:hypothetical protein
MDVHMHYKSYIQSGRVEKIEENEVQINCVLDGKNESVAISRYTFTK